MEWALTILFIAAILLFILSFVKTEQSEKDVHKMVDQHFVNLTDEINKLQLQIRNLEMDVEIIERETGIAVDRAMVREVLDMYRRNYQVESIASKNGLTQSQVVQMLAPYIKKNDERGIVANVR